MARVLLMLTLLGAACAHGGSADAKARSALNTLAVVIDPAYELAIDGCVASEQAEVNAERAGTQAPAVTSQHLGEIRARCDRVRAVFERMRTLHAEAAAAVEAGAIEHAEAKLFEVRGLWQALGKDAR